MEDLLSAAIATFADRVFARVAVFGIEVELIVLWLAAPMLFFTVWLGFINLRALSLAFRILRGHFYDPDAPGSLSQYAALTTALSGTVGLGNIAGVAIAISMGGPGAAFWMFVIGWFAMSLKCAEVTLGLKYRDVFADGSVAGGPMYYLRKGLARRGLVRFGGLLAVLYALLAIGGAGPFLQVNQSFAQVAATTGLQSALAYGLLIALATGLVIIGGVRWIGQATSRLVPIMGLIYVFGCLAILLGNAAQIGPALATIVSDAFASDSVAGGIIGAFIVGMRRAVYSSEAGIGTAVIAHSAAKTREPASEGLVALIEPFIDTVIICSLTAITLVVAGTYLNSGLEGIEITSMAFAGVFPGFELVLTFAVVLFAYSTILAWGYYGLQAWCFLFGHSGPSQTLFKLIYCCVLPIGALLPMDRVVDLIDSLFFLMAVPNVIGLYILADEVRGEIRSYRRRVASGELRPTQADGEIIRSR